MSEKLTDRGLLRRRLAVRSGLVLAYVLAVGAVFVLGKGHTLLIDNKDLADGSGSAIDGVLVSVDGREPLELYKGDRDMVKLKGQKHRVSIEPIAGGDKVEAAISLPLNSDMLLLSVPRLAGKQPSFIEAFVPRDQPRPADEALGDTNAFTSPDAVPVPTAP